MSLLRTDPTRTDEWRLREAIVETGRVAYRRGHLTANDGNISVRLSQDRILITPSGLCKGRLESGDLLVVDLDGNLLQKAADPDLKPTSEQPMHLEVYRQRSDVHAVLHAHPPYATALTVAGREIRNDVLPEVMLLMDEIPITDFAAPSSPENAAVIREPIKEYDAIMLRQHGSLTVGPTLDQALIHLDRLEHVARVLALAEMLGKVTPWPEDKWPDLAAVRAKLLD
jgi:L-fuculose-phosphate aldolase